MGIRLWLVALALPLAVVICVGVAQQRQGSARQSRVVAVLVETPVPEAAPSTARLRDEDLLALLSENGWPSSALTDALAVAHCESSLDPTAVGDLGERGLFQIHPVHDWRFDSLFGGDADAHDPTQNASVALTVWNEFGWAAWTCQPESA